MCRHFWVCNRGTSNKKSSLCCIHAGRILVTSWKSLKQSLWIQNNHPYVNRRSGCTELIWTAYKNYTYLTVIEMGVCFFYVHALFNQCAKEFYWFTSIEVWWISRSFIRLFHFFPCFCAFLYFVPTTVVVIFLYSTFNYVRLYCYNKILYH